MSTNKFSTLTGEAPDPIVHTMMLYAEDTSPNKVDVSIGVYKDNKGDSYTFPCVSEAKEILTAQNAGHNYTTMAGLPEFVKGSKEILFGDKVNEGKVASIQTLSGTGALHMAAVFLKDNKYSNYFVGTPAWTNYFSIINHVDGIVHEYNHYGDDGKVDFEAVLKALKSADAKSVFLLQVGCHNPTGADFTKDQWTIIGQLMKERDLIPVLDCAYLGFALGSVETDAWPIRYFYDLDIDFLVCQSFSKNLGLYGERVGALHVVVQEKEDFTKVLTTLIAHFRLECSFAPAYGARLASIIFESEKLSKEWEKNVMDITNRLKSMRTQLHDKLIAKGTPGNWETAIRQNGLFWFSGLSPDQNQRLIDEFHVYSTGFGRVNIAGLNEGNIDYFVNAVDHVVRTSVTA